jgi:hypothetical protein
MDITYLGLTVLLFAATLGLIRLCERLVETRKP